MDVKGSGPGRLFPMSGGDREGRKEFFWRG